MRSNTSPTTLKVIKTVLQITVNRILTEVIINLRYWKSWKNSLRPRMISDCDLPDPITDRSGKNIWCIPYILLIIGIHFFREIIRAITFYQCDSATAEAGTCHTRTNASIIGLREFNNRIKLLP